MPEAMFTIFSLLLAISLLVYLIIGIIFIAKKSFSVKTVKIYGILLMIMGLLNLVLFNMLVFKNYLYKLGEFISIILFFLIPFGEGFVLLSLKKMKARKLLGMLLILLCLFWLVVAVLS